MFDDDEVNALILGGTFVVIMIIWVFANVNYSRSTNVPLQTKPVCTCVCPQHPNKDSK